jgi:hypothetical protein
MRIEIFYCGIYMPHSLWNGKNMFIVFTKNFEKERKEMVTP